MRRKLFIISLALISGIYARFCHLAVAIGFFVIVSILMKSASSEDTGMSGRLKTAVVLSFIIGCLCIQLQSSLILTEHQKWDGRNGTWTAVIEEVSTTRSGGTCFRCRMIDIEEGKLLPVYRRSQAYIYMSDPPEPASSVVGRTITCTGELEEPTGMRNPNTFDYRLYLRGKGVYHTMFTQSVRFLPVKRSLRHRLRCRILRIRECYLDTLALPDENLQLLAGILFGMTDEMSEEMKQVFRDNGTAHILAVSGLHVGVIYGLYRRLTAKRKRRFDSVFLLFFLYLYGSLTMWTVSVIRAVMLITLMIIGDAIRRRYDLLTSLGFTASLIAIHNPYAIFGASFQLSFLAVLSISFITPRLVSAFPDWVPQEFPAMIAVQTGTMAYSAYTFNTVSMGALLCNIPVIWLLGILAPVGILSIPLVMLASFLAGHPWSYLLIHAVSRLLEGLTDLMLKLNVFLSQDGKFCLDVPSMPKWLLLGGLVTLFFLCSEYVQIRRMRGMKKVIAGFLILIMATSLTVSVFSMDGFRKADAVLVDVGQGDCLHVRAGQQVLLDGGGQMKRDVGQDILKPYLLRNGFRKIDVAAATHLHMDHYLGLEQLSKTYPVKAMKLRGKAGEKIPLGKGDFIEVIWPLSNDSEETDENLNSMVFKVHVRGMTILVTGDVGETGESGMLDLYKGTNVLKCDVLKAGHHGSKTSSTEAFIDAVNPRIAVIGVGENNHYGHPNREVLERFNERHIPVYRTDLHGAIGLWKRRGKIHVCTVIEPPAARRVE